MSKKVLIIAAVVILLLVGAVTAAIFLLKPGKKSDDTTAKKPPINEPVNVIDLTDRPYVTLTPRADGKELTLSLFTLPLKASEMEYEMEYQAGTLLQAAFGSIDLTSQSVPLDKKVLLGSCSAGGACTYHQDVQGGNLTLKFRADQNYALKDEWRFIETKEAEGEYSSRDSKFQLKAADALDKTGYMVIMQTSGLPAKAPGDIIAGPYGIYPAGGIPDKSTADLSMHLSEDVTAATIYGYNGTDWVKFDTTVADKTATASVDLMPVFIVTK